MPLKCWWIGCVWNWSQSARSFFWLLLFYLVPNEKKTTNKRNQKTIRQHEIDLGALLKPWKFKTISIIPPVKKSVELGQLCRLTHQFSSRWKIEISLAKVKFLVSDKLSELNGYLSWLNSQPYKRMESKKNRVTIE